jgi:hypothetical protein
LHAAGYLDDNNGSLTERGSEGWYWSLLFYDNNNGYELGFASDFCGTYNDSKAFGQPVRCLKDE